MIPFSSNKAHHPHTLHRIYDLPRHQSARPPNSIRLILPPF